MSNRFLCRTIGLITSKKAHLSQVELQDVADVVRVQLRELHQVLAVLKRLAQLLHPRLGPIHPVDALQSAETERSQQLTGYRKKLSKRAEHSQINS